MENNKRIKDYSYSLFVVVAFSVIFLQTIAIPVGGSQFSLVLIVVYGYLTLLALTNKLSFNVKRLTLFTIAFVFIFSLTVFAHTNFSAFSLMYLFILYLPFVLGFPSTTPLKKYLRVLQRFMFIIATISVLQFTFQLLHLFYLNLLWFLPESFKVFGYVSTYSVGQGSDLLKSNGGGLFLEASFLSQFIALSIIIEFVYFKRLRRLIILFLGLASSFSGTGLILLAVFGLFAFWKLRFRTKAFFLVLLVVAGISFFNSSYFELYQYRYQNEVASNNSDASFGIRFTNPYHALIGFMESDDNVFLGLGAGMSNEIQAEYNANFQPFPKLLVEYGFINAVLFMAFLLYSFINKIRQPFIAGPLFIMYFLLSGGLLQPHTVFLVFALLVLLPNNNLLEEATVKEKKKQKRKRIVWKKAHV